MHRLLLNFDELSIDHYLVELRFHSRDELVQNIAEREIGAVPLEKGAANRWPCCAVKNELRSKNADGIGDIARLHIRNRCRGRSGQWCLNIPNLRRGRFEKGCSPSRASRRCTSPARRRAENPRALQVWVDPFKICPCCNVRQRLGADLNDDAFGSLDLLLCAK